MSQSKSPPPGNSITAERLLAVVAQMIGAYTRDVPPAEMFNAILGDLLALTECEYAYIAEVRRDDTGNPYLLTWAISDIAWDDATREMYDEHAVRGNGIEFRNPDTLFGWGLLDGGRLVLCNDPAHDIRSTGRPPGHPPLRSYLGIPVLLAENLIGQIGLANRAGGFEERLAVDLEPLCVAIGWLIERSRADRDRREAESRGLMLECRHTAVLDSLHEIVTVIDPDGTWIESNLAGTRQLGYPKGFDPPGGLFALLHPEDREVAAAIFHEVLTGTRSPDERTDLRVAALDGSYRTYSVAGEGLTANEAVHGVLVTAHDVTHVRATERAERERSVQLAGLLETLHHPVLFLDSMHRVVWMNEAWRAVVGLTTTPADLVGSNIPIDRWNLDGVVTPPPGVVATVESHATFAAHALAAYEGGVPVLNHRRTMADGRVLEIDYVPLADSGDGPGHLWSTRDVTAQAHLELEQYRILETEQRQRSIAEEQVVALREIDRLKTEFVATVSHELRTPLATLHVLTEALLDSPQHEWSDEAATLLRRLQSSLSGVSDFVDDLLTATVLDTGGIKINPRFVNFEALVQRVAEDLTPLCIDAGLRMQLQGTGATDPAYVDLRKVETVIRNLVSNAVKFTPPGGCITITTKYDTGAWSVSVADTGVGIPADQIPFLFERFFRARNAITSGTQGTGLGLTIAHDLVVLHGGSITADSSATGTMVTVRFPALPFAGK